MDKEVRSTPAALSACAAAARQCAQVCRDTYASLTAETCAQAAAACESCATACDACADLWECRRCAAECRDAAAFLRQGPSDNATSAAYWAARACDAAAERCEQALGQPAERSAPPAERETRVCPADVAELRAEEETDENGGRRMFLSGIAAPFESLSHDLGGFRERIKRGAFQRSLENGRDVLCFPDHLDRATSILGRTASGTLKLSQNDTGLRFRVQLPDTSTGRDIFAVAKRGDLRGMSFEMRVGAESWREENGVVIREIDDLELYAVNPVLHPAYPASTVQVSRRALEHVEQLRKPPGASHRTRHQRRRAEIAEATFLT